MSLNKRQKRNALLTLALGVVFSFYFALKLGNLHDTAALYVGLPLLLAVVVSIIETEKPSATALKILTVAILLSPIVVGEGFICMIMASPIMYAVTYIFTKTIDRIRESAKDDRKDLKSVSILLVICLLSLEGTMPLTSFDRANEITVEKIVPLSVEQVRTAIAQTPKFDKRPASFYTGLFPGPSAISGSGLAVGDTRTIHLVYNKWVITNPLEGDVVFKVADKGDDFVKFALVEDKTYIDLYLVWKEATARFEAVDAKTTKVKVTLTYDRKLDPKWYFGPMERSAVRDAAETIIDSLSAT